jgi:hypothetical protein
VGDRYVDAHHMELVLPAAAFDSNGFASATSRP